MDRIEIELRKSCDPETKVKLLEAQRAVWDSIEEDVRDAYSDEMLHKHADTLTEVDEQLRHHKPDAP